MWVAVAGKPAGIRGARIGNRISSRGRDHIDVKVHQALPGNGAADAAHAMCCMTSRARKAIVDVSGVLAEAGVGYHVVEVVALAAKRIGPIHTEVGERKRIGDQLTRRGRLAELVAALEDVRPTRTVRAVRSSAAKFAIVVAVVAVAAEDLCAHAAALRDAIQIQHVAEQTGLRKRTAARMSHRMAGGAGEGELRYDVEEVAGGNGARGQISKDGIRRFARAGAVATQAVFKFVYGGIHGRDAIGRVDACYSVLRGASDGRRRKHCDLIGGVTVVAVGASGVPIVVEHQTLRSVVGVHAGRKGMADFGKFRENIGDSGG